MQAKFVPVKIKQQLCSAAKPQKININVAKVSKPNVSNVWPRNWLKINNIIIIIVIGQQIQNANS